MTSIGLGLLGAGSFATKEHLPAIIACKRFSLKAIWSRSRSSAEKLVAVVSHPVQVYFGSSNDSDSIDLLLARDDIQAVVVALPILAQPDIIKKALAAGKHVLSEKPIAESIATAGSLLNFHASLDPKPLWLVGENFRCWNSFARAANELRLLGGKVTSFKTNVQLMLADEATDAPETSWRQNPEYQGGLLLDAGIHLVAVTRFLLQAVGADVLSVSAQTSLVQRKLSPLDTVHSIWTVVSGTSGSFVISFGSEWSAAFEIEVTTERGSVKVSPEQVEVTARDKNGKKIQQVFATSQNSGVHEEMMLFLDGFDSGVVDAKLSPTEAFKDLSVLEAMLRSATLSGQPQEIPSGGGNWS